MKAMCTCGKEGHVQKRGGSFRKAHYIGFKGEIRKVVWHRVSSSYLNMVNTNGNQSHKSMVINNLNLCSKSENMAGGEGFEPSTPNLGGWCSIRTELLAQLFL